MLIKKITLIILLSLIILACDDSKSSKVDPEDYKSELRTHAKEFMTELKTVLQKNMKEGGPLQAVSVCSDTAQLLTQKYAENNNLTVKRVSIKNRNPNNTPNDFEESVLTDFESMFASGKLSQDTEVIQQITENDVEVIKYMKPIFVDAPCLLCHGQQSEILPQAAEIIKNNYPYDKATGYKIGDLRGAISISKKL
jgi:hypothetical protein